MNNEPFPKFVASDTGGGTPDVNCPKTDAAPAEFVRQPSDSSAPDSHIHEMLTALTLAIYSTRAKPHSGPVKNRRTSIEDGLAVARCMDTLDEFAKATLARSESWIRARILVEDAVRSISERNFFKAYEALDQLKGIAK